MNIEIPEDSDVLVFIHNTVELFVAKLLEYAEKRADEQSHYIIIPDDIYAALSSEVFDTEINFVILLPTKTNLSNIQYCQTFKRFTPEYKLLPNLMKPFVVVHKGEEYKYDFDKAVEVQKSMIPNDSALGRRVIANIEISYA